MRRWILTLFLINALLLSSCNNCKEPCVNGICIEKACSCSEWYKGDSCDELLLSEFGSRYQGSIKYDTVNSSIGFSLMSNATAPNELVADSLDLIFSFYEETRFLIDTQQWQGMQVFGDGQMLVDAVSFQFKPKLDSLNLQYTVLAQRLD